MIASSCSSTSLKVVNHFLNTQKKCSKILICSLMVLRIVDENLKNRFRGPLFILCSSESKFFPKTSIATVIVNETLD
ncbi:hypothetical protein CAEBREN_23875 [Caenorhabditis brenneri]|uniref:Uncharacterized protein n=1 Tax=Caenorhabditis brenneri TaxID=135651 RepID=G0NL16_CAEBE|nr:hypothetical protein CAEBREN_23875 [Caenorhabditis brenneri]